MKKWKEEKGYVDWVWAVLAVLKDEVNLGVLADVLLSGDELLDQLNGVLLDLSGNVQGDGHWSIPVLGEHDEVVNTIKRKLCGEGD